MGRRGARYVIAVHGGCGPGWKVAEKTRALKGVRAAIEAAREILEQGGAALDAVCAAVCLLEDDPLFNAGTGAALNSEGVAELDAAVMTGEGLHCGGVAGLVRVRNPVLVARRVMEDTPHVLLAGAGALAFARHCGFPDYDPAVHRPAQVQNAGAGTVGAVARDSSGGFAAATSTGGTSKKMPGRIGDSPIPGAGNYAGAKGATSATGNGELMMRILAAKAVCDLIASGKTAEAAVKRIVGSIELGPKQSAAMIAVDAASRAGFAMRGGKMPRGWYREGDDRISVAM
jgi:beta-aspartyl-peptidase (threonine type)